MTVDGHDSRDYAIGLARGFGGAVLFAFPLLMTMEMWWLGFYMERTRLLIFLLLNFLMLIGLGWFVGFERSNGPGRLFLEASAAWGVGIVASAAMLAVFGIIDSGMRASEVVGKIAVQAIPASIGATLARKELAVGGQEDEQDRREARAGYPGQLFLMAAGAVYVSFNVAPTEEMLLIAVKMTPLRIMVLVALSVGMLHAFVYTVGFRGQEPQSSVGFLRLFVSYTLAGYGVALLVSVYILWTFVRFDGASIPQIAGMVAVLGFPSALGAAVARLVV